MIKCKDCKFLTYVHNEENKKNYYECHYNPPTICHATNKAVWPIIGGINDIVYKKHLGCGKGIKKD